MALSKKQLAARKEIPASFVPALMAGNKDKIMYAWRRAVGDPTYVEEDLSMVWAPMFGSYIEKFALDWHSKKSHTKLTRRGEVVTHPDRPYVSCTLDAYDEAGLTVIDCKAPGMWRKLDDVIQYYTPQLIVQRECIVGSLRAAFLIVHGGSEPELFPVQIDPFYAKEVWARIDLFWKCVEDMTPPFEMEAALAPIVPVKTYDFSTDNVWCNEAGIWLENKEASKKFNTAAANIKKAIPLDGVKVTGGGITVYRNKGGALSIKEGN